MKEGMQRRAAEHPFPFFALDGGEAPPPEHGKA